MQDVKNVKGGKMTPITDFILAFLLGVIVCCIVIQNKCDAGILHLYGKTYEVTLVSEKVPSISENLYGGTTNERP